MYVKEDLIIPHHISFYDLIVSKARGKSGPLFHFDVHEDIRVVNDASREKDESHAGAHGPASPSEPTCQRHFAMQRLGCIPCLRAHACMHNLHVDCTRCQGCRAKRGTRREHAGVA